jgi:sugar-phosphatase
LSDLASIDAVLFDLDGTLVDSHQAIERAWQVLAVELGVAQEAALLAAMGRPADDTVRSLRPDLTDEDVREAASRQLALQYDDLADITVIAGATELLEHLDSAGFMRAVVTSCDRRLALARLAAVAIDPRALVTADDVALGKPHPEGYLRGASILGVEPDRCLVVEDTMPGVQAGKRAGMRVAGLDKVGGDIDIVALDELIPLLPHPSSPASCRHGL